jgi:cell wall-associated NlpC family hydrolase
MNTDDYIRIPFEELGRSRQGADCWGLACIIFKEERGIELPSLLGYSDTKDKVKISDIIRSESMCWELVEKGKESKFDIAVFRMLGQPMHIGIVIRHGLMIHCERGSGVHLTEYYKERQWDKRLEGFFRYADRPNITSTVPSASENA